jgi:hypothetical protein
VRAGVGGEPGDLGEHLVGAAGALVGVAYLPVPDGPRQVDHAGRQVVDVDFQAEAGRAARGEHEPGGGAPGAGPWRGLDLGQQTTRDQVIYQRGHGGAGETCGGGDVGAGRWTGGIPGRALVVVSRARDTTTRGGDPDGGLTQHQPQVVLAQ